jgi:hypothetical protein
MVVGSPLSRGRHIVSWVRSRFIFQTASKAKDTRPRSRGAMRPRFCKTMSLENKRAQGMPGASCTRSLACRKKTKHTSVVTTGSDGSTDIPRAMVLRLIPCSPRRRIRLVTVIRGLRFCRSPVGPTSLREFNTSNGCQNHTASPSAKSADHPARQLNRSRGSSRPATAIARLTLFASTASRTQCP